MAVRLVVPGHRAAVEAPIPRVVAAAVRSAALNAAAAQARLLSVLGLDLLAAVVAVATPHSLAAATGGLASMGLVAAAVAAAAELAVVLAAMAGAMAAHPALRWPGRHVRIAAVAVVVARPRRPLLVLVQPALLN